MTTEILTELRALSRKVDTIQSEISQLNKIVVDNLSRGQVDDSTVHGSQPENSFREKYVTPLGDSAQNSIESLLINDDPKSPDKPASGICTEFERDEEVRDNGQPSSEDVNGSQSLCIPSRETSVHERTANYYRRGFKEFKEECLRNAVQQNIVLLVDNLPCSENDILDMLIEKECLTETESSDLRHYGSRRDRVRNLVRIIKRGPYKVIKTFVECVKTLHPEVAASIWQMYERLIKEKKNYNRQCVFCVLKKSVDLKFLADHIWSVGAISDELYDEIVDGRTDMETLWTKISDECNITPITIRQNALRKVTEALMKKGQYRELVLKLSKLSLFKCACVKMDLNLGMFPLSLKITVTDCGESTSVSPMSTKASSQSFADGTEIISDDDNFPVNEHENYFLSHCVPENNRVSYTSCFGLRKSSTHSQGAVDEESRKSRSNSFGQRSFLSFRKRRASMFM